jgi:hypothetical protein
MVLSKPALLDARVAYKERYIVDFMQDGPSTSTYWPPMGQRISMHLGDRHDVDNRDLDDTG